MTAVAISRDRGSHRELKPVSGATRASKVSLGEFGYPCPALAREVRWTCSTQAGDVGDPESTPNLSWQAIIRRRTCFRQRRPGPAALQES